MNIFQKFKMTMFPIEIDDDPASLVDKTAISRYLEKRPQGKCFNPPFKKTTLSATT